MVRTAHQWLLDIVFVVIIMTICFGGSAYLEHKLANASLVISRWTVLAGIPFIESESSSLSHDYLVSIGGESAVKPRPGQSISLQQHHMDAHQFYWQEVILDSPVLVFATKNQAPGGQSEKLIAYAYASFNENKSRAAVLALGVDDGAKVWLNGNLVHSSEGPHALIVDEFKIPVQLNTGENHIVLKVSQWNGGWGSSVRFIRNT